MLTIRIIWLIVAPLVIPLLTLGNQYDVNTAQNKNVANSAEESEEELRKQLQDIHRYQEVWSDWSDWSACSRSCDGGISRQTRTCLVSKCDGEDVRFKICNMQSCPVKSDYRAEQCSSYDHIPYRGSLYKWFPFYDEAEPCALICRGRFQSTEDNYRSDVVENADIILKLAEKVNDGTLCRRGSLDMCIDGQCQRVGCDLRVGSNLQTDECGTCGGTGTCLRPIYAWYLKPTSLCSVTCGGGYRMVHPVCQNRVTGKEVAPSLCNAAVKPEASVLECNNHRCPARWLASEWSDCSETCGEGIRKRNVQCISDNNDSKLMVNNSECSEPKPEEQEKCIQTDCPKWESSKWSGCSVSCGEGVQVRIVECLDKDGKESKLCSFEDKPQSTKRCSTGIQCPLQTYNENDSLDIYPFSEEDQLPEPSNARAEMLVDEQLVPSENTFVADEWGPCSATCGEGIRTREVHCKIFLEISRTIVKLADEKCSGPKPSETESCYLQPCTSEKLDIKDDPYRSEANIRVGSELKGTTYSWKEHGYTHCSATCLGGVQELIVHCIRDDTQKIISPYLCPKELKPEILIRTCNDHPCPPKWNYSEFSPCSQTCGIGIQTRDVNCIHEVTQGSTITIIPNNRCPQPPPPDRQYCNVLDCPIKWRVSDWTSCSKSCGGGEKTRKVECKQVMAQNHTVDREPEKCPEQKPPDRKPCNTRSCVLETDKPVIDSSNSTFIQHDPKKKKVSLKIGGAATVFEGTTVKIKCPVKRFNRTKIQWMKDKRLLPKNKKFKSSKKGALRILNVIMRDSGTYTCVAGKSSANLLLSVRNVPGRFPNSEEIQRQMYRNTGRDFELADVQTRRDDLMPQFNPDEHSHEQRPALKKQKATTPKAIIFVPPTQEERYPILQSTVKGLLPTFPSTDAQTDPSGSPSSGSRTVPHFQQLVANLQSLAATKIPLAPDDASTSGLDVTSFRWLPSGWSPCSQTCGGRGSQMRWVKCVVASDQSGKQKVVDGGYCERAGLQRPEEMRKCGFEECPEEKAKDTVSCTEAECRLWELRDGGLGDEDGGGWKREQLMRINQHLVQI